MNGSISLSSVSRQISPDSSSIPCNSSIQRKQKYIITCHPSISRMISSRCQSGKRRKVIPILMRQQSLIDRYTAVPIDKTNLNSRLIEPAGSVLPERCLCIFLLLVDFTKALAGLGLYSKHFHWVIFSELQHLELSLLALT